jgi:hypothetical protein
MGALICPERNKGPEKCISEMILQKEMANNHNSPYEMKTEEDKLASPRNHSPPAKMVCFMNFHEQISHESPVPMMSFKGGKEVPPAKNASTAA